MNRKSDSTKDCGMKACKHCKNDARENQTSEKQETSDVKRSRTTKNCK